MREGTGVVAWSDTDASGRFHWAAALCWVENVEHEIYRAVPGAEVAGFPRRTVSVTYRAPLVAGDVYRVVLAAERVGSTSVTYRWQVLCDDTLCVEGGHVVVHVGPDGRPRPLPVGVRAELEHLRG